MNITKLKEVKGKKLSNLTCSREDIINAYIQIDKFKSKYSDLQVELNFSCNSIISEIDKLYKSENELKFDYLCRAGKTLGFIDSLGNLLPCEAITGNDAVYTNIIKNQEYSLLKNEFWDIWMNEEFSNVYHFDNKFRNGFKVDVHEECKKCKYKFDRCSICYYRNEGKI